jgi:VWFA-related protein
MTRNFFRTLWAALICVAFAPAFAVGAVNSGVEKRGEVRTVTIPVTIRVKEQQKAELQYIEGLEIFEDGERQEILATRGGPRSPLTLAVLIQDNLVSSVANEISGLKDFIRGLPSGSRVMVGYLRTGSLQVRQKFTGDLDKAARALRIPAGTSSLAPYNPFTQTRDAVKRFESQPVGRRAILLISDGLDLSRGVEGSTPGMSVDLQRAIDAAQRNGVAIYTLYAPTGSGTISMLTGNGQGSLNRLSNETGGHSFFQGTGAPVSFDHFLQEINGLLARQLALTYLSTHPKKGFHRLRVVAVPAEGKVHHPTGYPR